MTLKRFRYAIALIGMAGYWFLLANNLIIDGVETRLATPLAIGYAVGWFVLCCMFTRWMISRPDNPEVSQSLPDGDPLKDRKAYRIITALQIGMLVISSSVTIVSMLVAPEQLFRPGFGYHYMWWTPIFALTFSLFAEHDFGAHWLIVWRTREETACPQER